MDIKGKKLVLIGGSLRSKVQMASFIWQPFGYCNATNIRVAPSTSMSAGPST